MPDHKDDGLQYARDVALVYRHLGDALPDTATSAQRELHRWACNPDNLDHFYKMLAPKAHETLEKYAPSSKETSEVEEEKRSIEQLKTLLKHTINASRSHLTGE